MTDCTRVANASTLSISILLCERLTYSISLHCSPPARAIAPDEPIVFLLITRVCSLGQNCIPSARAMALLGSILLLDKHNVGELKIAVHQL